MALKKRFKVKLNSLDKIEELLQEQYNDADKNIVEAQNQINKIINSVDLNNEIADAKAKIAKAINDFIKTKDAAIGRKLEIAKLMTEIHKYNGNVNTVVSMGNLDNIDLETLKTMYSDHSAPNEDMNNNDTEEYILKP